jgi:hypothetical protein
MVRATSRSPAAGWLAVIGQLDRLTQAIEDAHRARAELVAVRRIGVGTGVDLVATREALTLAAEQPTVALVDIEEDAEVQPAPIADSELPADAEEETARRAIREAAQSFPASTRQGIGGGAGSGPPSRAPKPADRKERAHEDELER